MIDLNQAPKVLISAEQIAARNKELAAELTKKYSDKCPLFISTLVGSVFFATDLLLELDFNIELDFVRTSSYGRGDKSSGNVIVSSMPLLPLKDRHVVIIEDIIDSGNTLSKLKKLFMEEGPASLEVCSLLDKPSRREVDFVADYVGFTIPDYFVVGYGLDYANHFRNLKDVCYFE
jgi:hypoxanthine phosphoribosyltransferase